jgi:hypothetical protein
MDSGPGGAPFVGFEVGDALVEGEGLLDLFQTLRDALEADAVHFFHGVKALINGHKLAPHFMQFRREETVQDLANILDNAHGRYHSWQKDYPLPAG